jgi:hypothetical protein
MVHERNVNTRREPLAVSESEKLQDAQVTAALDTERRVEGKNYFLLANIES